MRRWATPNVPRGARLRWTLAMVGLLVLLQTISLFSLQPEPVRAAPASAQVFPDFNEDGTVNGVDFAIFARDYGKTGTGLAVDLNKDNAVNGIDLALFARDFGRTQPNCLSIGSICHVNVSTTVTGNRGTITLGDCASPADPVNCARFTALANGFTVTGRWPGVTGTRGVDLTIPIVDATTGVPGGTRIVNCPFTGAVCNSTVVAGNIRPLLGGTVTLATQAVGAPASPVGRDQAFTPPGQDPT